MRMVRTRTVRWFLLVLWAASLPAMGVTAEPAPDFSRDIRPLLSDNCFRCHGPDEQQGDVRFDTRAGAFADLGGYHAIVPGKAAASELYKRITAASPEERMPPPDSGRELTPEQRDLFGRWIDAGAPWKEHWAFTPAQRPALPSVERKDWPENPIDNFILARLEEEGLSPSREADRRTLIRRVTFDLTGLPPTPEEVEAFVSDPHANAYAKVVDRLLNSEHYGEHMGRFWLDVVRYADTHGLHLDNYREMWPYRDWVIAAFNRNEPYDQFALQQLAGDLLPESSLEQKIASGYNRLHVSTNEGGVIREEVYVRNVVDRVESTGTIFLGLTLGCAVCHDHKFDPISQKEFYQLFAFFNSMDGKPTDGNRKDPAPVVQVPTEEQAQQLAGLDLQLEKAEAALRASMPEVDAAQVAWEERWRRLRDESTAFENLDPVSFFSQGGATLVKLDDRSILASKENPRKEVYEVIFHVAPGTYTGLRLEGLVHESLPYNGAGRSADGRVTLSEFEAEVAIQDQPLEFTSLKFSRAWADLEGGRSRIEQAIDGDAGTGWATDGHKKREDRTAIFALETPLVAAPGTRLRVRLRHESKGQRQFGRFRLGVTGAAEISELEAKVPAEIATVLGKAAGERGDEDRRALLDYYRLEVSENPEVTPLGEETRRVRSERDELVASIPTTLVMKETEEPKEAFALIRGQYDQKGEKVERLTPAALPPMDAEYPRDRLGLARWLLEPSHPLTARVAVNRFWQQCFGLGIVKTAEDFGNQGEPPAHPALLDWLAVDFVESGWNIKRVMRMLVMSKTYRQSSGVTPELLDRDPENRLLARGPRFRLDAEMLRDQALAVSGLLVRAIGGPSVKPPQPDGLWHAVGYTSSNTANFKADAGEKIYRRSLYTFWKRTAPPPQMKTFDAPSRESCTARRERTNTPLQALVLMNEPQYVEAARQLAIRVLRTEGLSVEARAAWAFRLATAREPGKGELAELVATYRDHLAHYRSAPDAAGELIRVGASEPDPALDPVEVAAWTLVANLILNLDEVVTKE